MAVNITDLINATANVTSTGLGVVKDFAHGITGLVPVGFTFGLEHLIELLIIHLIFIFVLHRFIGVFKGVIVAGIASVALPIALNKFFGFAIPLTAETLATFALFGIGIYIILAVFWKLALKSKVSE